MSRERSDSTVDRRRFLALAVAGAASALVPGCDRDRPGENSGSTGRPDSADLPTTFLDLPELLRAYFSGADLSDAAAIGAAYAERFAGNREELMRDLAATASEVESARTVDEAIHRLETRIENDFAEGQHQSLEGWILASTELRLCALVHVLIRPPERGSASG